MRILYCYCGKLHLGAKERAVQLSISDRENPLDCKQPHRHPPFSRFKERCGSAWSCIPLILYLFSLSRKENGCAIMLECFYDQTTVPTRGVKLSHRSASDLNAITTGRIESVQTTWHSKLSCMLRYS